jgi:hypothetical protein
MKPSFDGGGYGARKLWRGAKGYERKSGPLKIRTRQVHGVKPS